MSIPETVPTWPRIEAVAREDGTGEVIVNGNPQPVAAGNLDEVRVAIIRNITEIARNVGRPVRVSTSGPDGYWPLIVHPDGAVTADEDDQPRPGRRAAVEETGAGGPASADTPASLDHPQPVEVPVPDGPGSMADDHRSADQGEAVHQSVSEAEAVPLSGDHDQIDRPSGDGDDHHDDRPGPADPQPNRAQSYDPVQQAAEPAGLPAFGQTNEAPVGPPSGPESPSSAHQPTRGATGPWPDQPHAAPPDLDQQPAPVPQPSPVRNPPPSTRTFGQPPAGPPPVWPVEQQHVGQPQVGQPPVGQPQVGQPQVGQPQVGQPQVGQPQVGQPQVGQPPARAAGPSTVGQRSAGRRPAGQHAAGQQPAERYRPQRSADQADQLTPQQRQSFLTREQIEDPASRGFRGFLGKVGIRMSPNEAERAERADVQAVSQHWPGPRTIAIVNGKGGAGKSPSTVLLSAVFALFGGAGVVAWDNNQTRGTLGWRTEQGPHESTLHDLLPEIPRLLGTGAQSADLAHYVHHQTRDRFDVLRSQPMVLAHMQRLEPRDVDAIHSVLGKYYRLIFIDSGNDESDPMWLRMIDHADQLVVATTTRDDHAEAGALLLEALADRDERSAALARSSVAIVSQADPSARPADLVRVAAGYQALTRATVTIPFDPGMVDGLLRYGSLKPETKRAWLAAAAAVARGL